MSAKARDASTARLKPPASLQHQESQYAEVVIIDDDDEPKTSIASQNLLFRASAALQPQDTSGQLPCREEEQETISCHLRLAIRNGGSHNVLYVSGMPGTGKTASVLQAIEKLQPQSISSTASQLMFTLVHVNAMCLNHPKAVYGEILKQLQLAGLDSGTGRRCGAGPAMQKLQTFFERRKSQDLVVVLLIDEVDCLATRNQAVLYHIFNWLMLPRHRLVLAAISNTMDLPERLLPRVSSRFGLVRVDFQPYRKDQINEILNRRLDGQAAGTAFEPVVLKLCAARIAAGSGDIRKALQLCRRALDLCQQSDQQDGPVGLDHMRKAEQDLLHANPSACAIRHVGRKARLFLSAFVLELRKCRAECIPFWNVSVRYAKLSEALNLSKTASGQEALQIGKFDMARHVEEAAFLVRRLEAMSLLMQHYRQRQSDDAEASESNKVLTLSLQSLDVDDFSGALQETETEPVMLELLQDSF
jgi:Cdc6-like AAA superfamily ATPase